MKRYEAPPEMFSFSKDRRLRGNVVTRGNRHYAYIYDNKKASDTMAGIILTNVFEKKQRREAHEWLYEKLDCPTFTLLSAM